MKVFVTLAALAGIFPIQSIWADKHGIGPDGTDVFEGMG